MRLNTRPSNAGKHRKVSSRTKGRVAIAAAVATTVSSAGIGGAAAATLTNEDQPQATDVNLVNDSQAITEAAVNSVPQILNLNEHKPTANANEQLNKAVDYSNQLAAEAQAAAQAEADRLAAEAAAATTAVSQGNFDAAAATSSDAITGAAVVKPAQGTFTSGFGPRWGTMHNGIDIANGIGTPILAAMAGTVIDSGPASGYGQWIRIQHDDGSMTVYGHMSTLAVSVGQRVEAGQNIAGMGSEGQSTGSHLHFEIHPAGSGPVDPQAWLASHGISL
ncbi:M23 family metallopeptidase [Corynebacterium lubricantis]|uniref:M23 family metallopeptidase n=1 Tax=Corynebacterium lubricantis TaxID=541095 RepID=UPI00036D1A5B|nr:M23 family metallopeptidase [Corynebacterium lubricantis]